MRVKLEDVCERGSSNIKQSDIIKMSGNYSIYGASGLAGKVNFYHQEQPYVAVVKDGAGIGRTTLNPAKSSVIGTMQYLIPKKNVLPEYLFYVVSYMHLEKYYTGATIPHIYFKDYKNEEFNLDNIEKQLEIIDVLGRCKKVIEARKQELVELDSLTKARFVEVFGDININDKNWECEFLGNLCTIVRGGSPRPIEKFLGGDVPWIKIGDATEADNIYLSSTKEHIIKEGEKNSRLVKEGSLIFANCGVSLGFARIITFDGCIHDGWLAMEDIDKRLDNAWYSGNDDPKLEEEHARLKAEYDKLSQNTKGLYQAHRDEHIRISGLFCLKIGAVVMLVSVLTQMATVVLEGYGTHKKTGGA